MIQKRERELKQVLDRYEFVKSTQTEFKRSTVKENKNLNSTWRDDEETQIGIENETYKYLNNLKRDHRRFLDKQDSPARNLGNSENEG